MTTPSLARVHLPPRCPRPSQRSDGRRSGRRSARRSRSASSSAFPRIPKSAHPYRPSGSLSRLSTSALRRPPNPSLAPSSPLLVHTSLHLRLSRLQYLDFRLGASPERTPPRRPSSCLRSDAATATSQQRRPKCSSRMHCGAGTMRDIRLRCTMPRLQSLGPRRRRRKGSQFSALRRSIAVEFF